jgi:hypothetical protein
MTSVQMLVDAMSVFLPDDPDGNAKLVFSILDCLPKANRVSQDFFMVALWCCNPNTLSSNAAPCIRSANWQISKLGLPRLAWLRIFAHFESQHF